MKHTLIAFAFTLYYKLYTLFYILFCHRNNTIIIHKNDTSYRVTCFTIPIGLKVKFIGNNNVIHIQYPVHFEMVSIVLHCDNSTIEIGKNCRLRIVGIFLGNGSNASIKIGNHCSAEELQIISRGSSALVIEDDCMFATNIIIRLTDSHPIYDRDSKELLNAQKRPATIGAHSWIGQNVFLTKNVAIPPHTIIGLGSVVSGEFTEEYTCLAGNPAKIVKRNVIWTRELIK